jgi:hypothetical protein
MICYERVLAKKDWRKPRKLQAGYPATRPWFDNVTLWIQVKNVTAKATSSAYAIGTGAVDGGKTAEEWNWQHTCIWCQGLECVEQVMWCPCLNKRPHLPFAVPLAALLRSGAVAKFNEESHRRREREEGEPSITSLSGLRQKPAVPWNTNVVISSHRRTTGSRLADFHGTKLKVEL